MTPRSRGVVMRADGRTLRRFVVYLPPELGQKLVVRCASEGVDISSVFTEAVAEWFQRRG